ncbi:MAG: amidase [Planctomycetes bacterium]|nr:amidase [Planctomycetota bacterium]
MSITDKSTQSRRQFFVSTSAIAAAAALPSAAISDPQNKPVSKTPIQITQSQPQSADVSKITQATLAEAEKLVGVEFTPKEREQMLQGMEDNTKRFKNRRSQELQNALAPATVFDPRFPGVKLVANKNKFIGSTVNPGPLPRASEDIAFAPVTALSYWIKNRKISSRRLTDIYIRRLRRIGPKLECVVTITNDLARQQAARADEEIKAGNYRGPLHGIPWGAKDLFDTAGITTSWGATPYKDRVPDEDAAVVKRLDEAGAVLIAKTTLGALAYGDIWFGGRTNNPWKLDQGSSGSSAGSSAGTAAGLFGFSLGTETLGSIVSPCMRCGTTGLRPTFGRVSRAGAMALCWSLDKVGPICRTVEDCALVLDVIRGHDPADASSIDMPFEFDATKSVSGLRVGYSPGWFDGRGATDNDRAALDALKKLGLEFVEVELPKWPYGMLMTILMSEAASAFEELTLSNLDDELVWQKPEAWPNSFRQTRFTPAIEFVQAQRFRRKVMQMMDDKFADIDVMISPSFAARLLLITNNTGHPSLTMRCGFNDDGTPHGITMLGRLFDEGTLCRIGMALEKQLNVWHKRPPAV